MTSKEIITTKGLSEEKGLVLRLISLLEEELESVSNGDASRLEESMPQKQKLINKIIANRDCIILPDKGPSREDALKIRNLQQELIGLWRKATGLNEVSKGLVRKRLSEIDEQLKPFFPRPTTGYDKSGKRSTVSPNIIKGGV
ncbi:MAG: flagellar export chaperone FlgN [Thermodesulfobacteriota bacterium]|nr:flagellar export chaperone FlgN [Thermodesulfobacteriota bacterium]